MRGLILVLAIAVLPTPALADAAACPFKYTPELRKAVIEPEIDRITSGHAADYRTEDPEVFIEANGNVRLQFLFRGLDGDEPVVTINPCTEKIVSSANFPAFPQLQGCPPEAHAPASAWCVKPEEKKDSQ